MVNKKYVLIAEAHADDGDMCVGGTAARLVKEGWHVDLLLVCNLARIKDISKRIEEAQAAAEVLGVGLQIMNLQEGNFRDIPRSELVARLDEYFSLKYYDKVFVPCHRDSHSDHKFLAEILFSVCRKNTCDLLIFESAIPSGIVPDPMSLNYFVNISNEIEQKMKAIYCHKSQLEQYGEGWVSAIEARSRFWGQKFGWNHAEAFNAVKILV